MPVVLHSRVAHQMPAAPHIRGFETAAVPSADPVVAEVVPAQAADKESEFRRSPGNLPAPRASQTAWTIRRFPTPIPAPTSDLVRVEPLPVHTAPDWLRAPCP